MSIQQALDPESSSWCEEIGKEAVAHIVYVYASCPHHCSGKNGEGLSNSMADGYHSTS